MVFLQPETIVRCIKLTEQLLVELKEWGVRFEVKVYNVMYFLEFPC